MTNEMVVEYDGYIKAIVNKYYSSYPNKDDLFQAGRVGLIKAYYNFDSTKGAKFSTYAFFDIKGEMSKLIHQDKAIKVNITIRKLKLKIEKAMIILTQQLMRQPNVTDIANFLEVSELEIVEAMQAIYTTKSIDEPINVDGKEMTYHDMIGNNEIDMTTLIAYKEVFRNLLPYEKELLKKRILEGKTQSEIADELGINQVQVSRKVKKINDKIYQMVA